MLEFTEENVEKVVEARLSNMSEKEKNRILFDVYFENLWEDEELFQSFAESYPPE